jgi:hypothetical protein
MRIRAVPALMAIFIAMSLISGCAMFRYAIIPQDSKGPHGGAVAYIDQRVPNYVEFVAIPDQPAWTMQVYVYDRNMKQRSICGSGYVSIELPDGAKKGIELWNTAPYFWSKGKGHLENKIELGDIKEFTAKVSIARGRSRDRLIFKYPH